MFFNLKEPFTFDRAFRLLLSIAIVVFILYIISYLSDVLTPFFIAIILAYILNPTIRFFQYKLKLKKRWLSVLVVLFLLFGCTYGLTKLLSPMVSSEISHASKIFQTYSAEKMLNYDDSKIAEFISENFDKLKQNNELMQVLKSQDLGEISKKLMQSLGGIYSSSKWVISFVMATFLGVLYFLFALLQYDSFFGKWKELIPKKKQKAIKTIANDVETAVSNYFRGQFLVASIVGVLFAIGFKIIGLPMAILLGLFVGMLNMVPYLQILGFIPATFLAFIYSVETQQDFYVVMAFVLLVFVIVQIIEDGFLIPKIMGKTTGLNAVVILLGLSVWGKLLGIVGLLLAIPLTSLILAYYKSLFVKEEEIDSPKVEE